MALILDTSPLLALIDRRDAAHAACRDLVERSGEPLVIPSPVLPEVDYFITTRLHSGVRLVLLENIRAGALSVENLQDSDYERIQELCETYQDANVGFVDAAVLAITERLNEPKLATLDRRHFGLMRPRHVSSLTLLP